MMKQLNNSMFRQNPMIVITQEKDQKGLKKVNNRIENSFPQQFNLQGGASGIVSLQQPF